MQLDLFPIIEKCKCGKNDCEDEHPCPFLSDIHDDEETLCNCCGDCQHECAMDI
jgi:hypothetical protein